MSKPYPPSPWKPGDRAMVDAGYENATEVTVVYPTISLSVLPACRSVRVRADDGYEWVTMEKRLTPITTQ